jgi:peptide/nickel transport system substrate-binding protein
MRSIVRIRFWRMAAVAATAALFVGVCSSGTTLASTAKHGSGGVVTYAERPASPPDYIFPLTGFQYFSITNNSLFSNIMYPSLYWFGIGSDPVLNPSLSVAHKPVFTDNNTVATITLKHWIWSNGKPITARDVVFWMNLLSAVTDPKAPAIGSSSAPGPGWGAEVPGGFPVNVVSYKQTGTYTIVFKLNASYNPTWYLYNELSQITPLPQQSWDLLSSGGTVGNYDASAESRSAVPNTTPVQYVPTNPGTASSGALGVAQFLNTQAQDLATYATNPLWQVVNGPFKLSQYTTGGFVKMVPNKNYSGSPKPTISAFEELPYTSDLSEFDALRTGSLTIGFIPIEDLSQKSTLEHSEGYKYNPWYVFATSDWNYNFTSSTHGAIFKQLYFRQAVQSLVNQPQYIKDFQGGLGIPTNGPVPAYPRHNPDISPLEARKLVYPYDPAKAVSLLKAHGWTVVPSGASYCSSPGTGAGHCGAGIKSGQKANFTALYANGNTELSTEMAAFQSAEQSHAGIHFTIREEAPPTMAGQVTGCRSASPCNDWDLEVFGGDGWVYSPDYFPTGEEIFQSGAESNLGQYSDPTANALIDATTTAPTHGAEIKALFKYENYISQQLPLVNWPSAFVQATAYKSDLKGFLPQQIYQVLTPQYYRVTG